MLQQCSRRVPGKTEWFFVGVFLVRLCDCVQVLKTDKTAQILIGIAGLSTGSKLQKKLCVGNYSMLLMLAQEQIMLHNSTLRAARF